MEQYNENGINRLISAAFGEDQEDEEEMEEMEEMEPLHYKAPDL